MAIKLIVYGDYLCSWCYLSQHRIAQIKVDYAVEVEWRAFELHPDIPPDAMQTGAYTRIYPAALARRLHQLAAQSGMPLVLTETLPSSRRAHEATEYARAHGRHEAFHRAVFHSFYGEGRDISRWSVLREAAREAGLDGEALQSATERGDYRMALDRHVMEAEQWGIDSVPAFVFAKRFVLCGLQPYSVVQNVMAKLGVEAKSA